MVYLGILNSRLNKTLACESRGVSGLRCAYVVAYQENLFKRL